VSSQTRPKTALIVFAKEPEEGKVKTRLSKDLAVPLTIRLYKAFVKDILAMTQCVDCDQRFIYYRGHPNHIPFLKSLANDFVLKRQRGQDLGMRLYNVFHYAKNQGFTKTVIIGSDCLTIKAADIRCAFNQLDRVDCVLGPCRDGGYYLVGLKVPFKGLFSDIPWSSSEVLAQSLKVLSKF